MGKYAYQTKVSVDQTRAEIERTLERYGANQFTFARDDLLGKAVVQFRAKERYVRYVLVLPRRDGKEFRRKTEAATYNAWEAACRQRWRALLLIIKAKLEAVESQISEFEDEFLAHIVLPDGKTASEWLRPQIAVCYETGKMPESLLALPAPGPV